MVVPKRRLLLETLTIGTMVVKTAYLADELYRLYMLHKPKHKMGFTPAADKKRWYRR